MAIRAFSVGPRRGLVTATAENLPDLVVIAGANGSGKSALLEQLWAQRTSFLDPGTEALYVGPNRTWRAGPLSDVATRAFTQDFEQILKLESFPGFQYAAPGGFHFLSGLSRFGSNADDAQAFVKTSIVRIHNRVDGYIAQQYRNQGNQIASGTVPDLMGPFRELVSTLLPHLEFVDVDNANVNDIRVLFRSRDPILNSQTFDIDDLSSGEKAAVALFLPFIEREVRSILEGASNAHASSLPEVVPISLLLDEPEIHLHPLLQLNVLGYMRDLTASRRAQFILTTHSPTLLDALEPTELFLLSPASIAPDNQLSRLTESSEKLEIARTITGATHVLTRGKPIVFTEGLPDTSKVASDVRLMKMMVPQAEHWALVPAGGRSNVIKSVEGLLSTQAVSLPGMPVFGLIDGDQGSTTDNDRVITWPVAMVENLLLDVQSIVEILAPYAGSLPDLDNTTNGIQHDLRTISQNMVKDEVRLRIKQRLPSITLRPSGETMAELEVEVDSTTSDYKVKLQQVDPSVVAQQSRDEVNAIVAENKEFERFRGKMILREFYNSKSISQTGLGWNAFVTELARVAANSDRTRELVKSAASRITLYFPKEVSESLIQLQPSELRDKLLAQANSHRQAWSDGAPLSEGRERLRQELMGFGRDLRDGGDQRGSALMRFAASIGTQS